RHQGYQPRRSYSRMAQMFSIVSRLATRLLAIVLAGLLVPASRGEGAAADSKQLRSRKFEFTYATTVTGLPERKLVRVWLPVPPCSGEQQVKMIARDLPEKHRISGESKCGNEILYVEARAGEDGTVPLSVTYRVTRYEVKADLRERDEAVENFAHFLKPDAKVPTGGKPLELVKDKKIPEDQLPIRQLFYELVNSHMRYSKEGIGW